MRGLLSRTAAFHFEAVRALWYAPYDGADYGEVISAVSRVRRGSFESWYTEWSGLATAVAQRGEAAVDDVSRGKAQLRSSNYMRAAEFFLSPDDPRRASASAFARSRFDTGTRALGVDVTRSRIPLGDDWMETIFLRSPKAAQKQDVLVVHGGFDSTPEELYFTIGAAALERGFHCLIFEGPGQGNLLREFGRPFTPEWEEPASVALDSLTEHCIPHSIIGVGVSLGGHLLARAAAYEPRYDGIVLYDYFPGMLDVFRHNTPAPLRGQLDRMPSWLQVLLRGTARFDAQLRWAVQNALWTFGADSLPDLIGEMRRYDDSLWADRIATDVLMLVAEKEHFYAKDLAYDFAARLSEARSVTVREFTEREGGHLHCQNGAIHLAHEVIFDWAREIAGQAAAGRAMDPVAAS